MTDRVNEIIDYVVRERGIDRRLVYVSYSTSPPVIACSDPELAVVLRARLANAGYAQGVQIDVLPRPGTPALFLVATPVADVRREPSHRSELVSQAVHGDAVTPLTVLDEWTLVRMDDAYIGWIRNWYLKPCTPAGRDSFLAAATHRIKLNHAPVLDGPGGAAITELVTGTPLVVGQPAGRGWMEARLADGTAGFVSRASVEKLRNRRPRPAALAETAQRFTGIAYLWGGTTPNGFDCSGLIQRVFRLNGLVLPRDSDQQAHAGAPREVAGPADLTPGNLVFFGKSHASITHVGLVLPDLTFIHCYGQVVVNSLDPSHPRYLERLASIWQRTTDPLAKPARSRRR